MLLVLVVSFICLSTAAPSSRHQRTPVGGRVKAATHAKAPYDAVTGSWVDSQFSNPSCAGSSEFSNMGNYGLCMTNFDESGVAFDAFVDVVDKVDDNFIYSSHLSFGPPFDCSGVPKSVQNGTTALKCDTGSTESWIMGYAPASDAPWAPFTKGVVTK